jgi:predicted nucleic acid-binding protein
MTILDTNVISAVMSDPPDARVTAWLNTQAPNSVWTTAVTVFEVQAGLKMMPAGKRQIVLTRVFEMILADMDHRIAVFDEESARLAANLTAFRRQKGKIVEFRDTMIAGIVLSHHASLATRNTMHFSDISATVVNPWDA